MSLSLISQCYQLESDMESGEDEEAELKEDIKMAKICSEAKQVEGGTRGSKMGKSKSRSRPQPSSGKVEESKMKREEEGTPSSKTSKRRQRQQLHRSQKDQANGKKLEETVNPEKLPMPPSKIENKETPYRCPFCLAGFAVAMELIQHLPIHKTVKIEIKAEDKKWIPEKIKSGPDTSRTKIANKKDDGKGFICKICKKPLTSRRAKLLHMRAHAEEKRFQCEKCDAAFKQSSSLGSHMNMHDESREFKCSQCNYHFLTPGRLRLHVTQVHDGMANKTDHRAVVVSSTDLGDNELQSKAIIYPMIAACKVALTRCDNLVYLNREKTAPEARKIAGGTNTGNKLIPSKSSKIKAGDRASPQKFHLLNTQKSQETSSVNRDSNCCRIYKCPTCSKTLASAGSLYNHIKTHNRKPDEWKPYPRSFPTPEDLKTHQQKTHLIPWKYPSPTCSKGFKHNCELKVRIRIHTREKPYKCSLCSKRFASKTDVKIHFRTHTGVRPYECPKCGRRFSQSSNMSTHLKKIHK